MANNKKVYTNVKIEQSVLINIAYLELSEDGGATYEVIDQITIPANSTPTVADFDLMPTIDVDNPLFKVRVKVVPQTTTTTSTTSTTTSTTTTTTTEAPSPFRYATEQDALDIYNANVGDMLLTGPNWGNEIKIQPSENNTFTLDPCKKILIKGGNYDFIRIEVPGLTGTEECPIIITNYDGQVRCKSLGIVGISHYKLTGKYDPINLTGDENYQGHANGYANTAGTYGIFVDNQWTNTNGHLLSLSGSYGSNGKVSYQSTSFELEYIETGNGAFSNVIKTDGAIEPMNNVRIHDMYIHDTHGEGIYIGSTQGDPQHAVTNLHFYNNRVLRAGNDGIQLGQLQQGCVIENNVVHGAVNWKSPFAGYQDNSVQLSLRNGGIVLRNNIFIAGGEKWLNFFVNKIKDSSPSGFIDIDNNAFLHCRGTLGVYFGQSNPMELDGGVRLRSNFFGRFLYQYDEVWDSPIANNSPDLIRVGMRCKLLIAGNRWDGSDGKLNLYYPEPFAVPYITTIDNVIDLIPDVEFIDYMGFPVGFDYLKVELWSRFVGVYENEDSGWFPVEGSKKYDPIYYHVDDYVTHKSKVYRCLVENTNKEPGVEAGWTTYWEHVQYDGNNVPTDDVRLVSTSFYNGRGMGLVDNPSYNGPSTTTTSTSTSTTTTLAPTTTTTTTLPVTPAFNYKTYVNDNGDNTYIVKWGINQAMLTDSPRVAGLGSSTIAGSGNSIGSGLGDRLNAYFGTYGGTFINLGQGQYYSKNWMPRGSNSEVDDNKNSSAASMLQPTFALLITATNDVEKITPEEALSNIQAIHNDLRNRGIVCFIEACQPRTGYHLETQVKLIHLKNLIKSYFPAELVIDTMDVLKDPNSSKPADYLPAYANPDGIHLNDTGAGVLFDLVKNRIEATLIDSDFVEWEIERSTNPNTGFTLFDTIVGGSVVQKTYNRQDNGQYYFRARGKRADNSYGNYTISSNVLYQQRNIGEEEQTIQVDFSDPNVAAPPEDWANLIAPVTGPVVGTIYSNLIDSNYVTTSIEVEVIAAFDGVGSAGGTTGKYPLRVMQDYWFKSNSTKANAVIRIGNLDASKIYSLEFLSARSGGEQRYLGISCNDRNGFCFATIMPSGLANQNATSFIRPLYPDTNGDLFVYFSGFPIGHLNSMVIHRHKEIAIGETTTTTTSTSTSTSSTTTTTTTLPAPDGYTINVNFNSSEFPYSNAEWNDWNLGNVNAPSSISNLKYANGTDSNFNASISYFTNYFDNGEDYGSGIMPAEVLRNGFFLTETDFNSTIATITLSGLNNLNRYSFEFVGSRNNLTNNKTVLQAIGTTTVNSPALLTDKNKNNSVKVENIYPVGGTIILKVRRNSGDFAYANGLRISEILPTPTTTTTSTSSSTTTTTSTAGTTTTTTSTSSTTTTTTTIAGQSTFVKINNWKADSSNQYGWIYTPPNYDNSGATKYPFVVFLHGQGERGTGSTDADMLVNSTKGGPGKYLLAGDTPQNIVYFIPQLATNPGTWEPNWVEAARSYVINNYNGDADFFYLTGLSLGASGTSKYVMTYPDRVAAYLLASGDTQYQRDANTSATVNGVRQVDVPGWFHGGVADSTISVNNGIGAMSDMNAMNPKPTYPYLVDTYWGLGHENAMWDGKVYNRKNRTDATGTAVFDYIEWFRRFKANNLLFNSTSYVSIAEGTNDYNDYLVALRLVSKLSAGTDKTDLLNRLGTVKGIITAANKVLVINFGSANATGSINNVNLNVGGSVSNLIDIDGNATNIGFSLVASRWSPPDVSVGSNNDYFGFDSAMFSKAFRVYSTPNTWRLTGLNDLKNYTIRFFYGNITENTTARYGAKATINGVTKNFEDENVNTTKYVDFNNVYSTSGIVNISLESIATNSQGDVTAMVIFESVVSGTSTTTTSTSSTTTTTTLAPTTSTTTTSTTGSPTTTTTTTISPTTTTTTTNSGVASAKFNFNNTAQSISGWKDVSGSPDAGVITATDNINGTGITISSISGKWGNFGGTSNNTNGGTGTSADFPANVMISYWYNYALTYPSYGANLKLSNLTPNASYQLKMIGSRSSTAGSGIPAGQNRIMEFVVSQAATTGHASEQSTLTYVSRDSVSTQTFTINSNASGEIYLGVYPSRNGNGTNGDQFGYLNGLIVEKL